LTITIDWKTSIINIPKADLTLVQTTPSEIRQLDINDFRLILKALEASVEGMPFPKTHVHYPEITVSGVTLARSVIILEPYTITFENGQYAVNLINANSNIADRVNVNQVSVRSSNSAGLAYVEGVIAIEYGGRVCFNPNSPYSGTVYPRGTLRMPVNNIDDALLIANYRGFKEIYLMNDYSLSNIDIEDFVIAGISKTVSLVVQDSVHCQRITIKNCKVNGVLDGESTIENCLVGSLNYVNGTIQDSGLYGLIILDGNEECVINNCYTYDQDNLPIIDMGGSGNDLSMPNYNGIATIINLNSDTEEIGIGLSAGMIMLGSSITAGTITISGNGILIDNSTGTASVDITGLMNVEAITQTTWDTVYIDSSLTTTDIKFPMGTKVSPVGNIADAMTIARNNNINLIDISNDLIIDVDVSNMKLFSNVHNGTTLTLTGSDITSTSFTDLIITGDFGGYDAIFNNCNITQEVTNINGSFDNCVFGGTFTVSSSGIINANYCTSAGGLIIDCNVNSMVNMGNFSGILTITNLNNPSSQFAITGYYLLTLDTTCVSGQALLAGIGIVNNQSTLTVTNRTLPYSMWEESVSAHTTSNTFGLGLQIAMGLSQHNFRLETLTTNLAGDLKTGRMYIYKDNTKSEIIKTYLVTATWNGSVMSNYEVLEE